MWRLSQVLDSGACSPGKHAGEGMLWLGEQSLQKQVHQIHVHAGYKVTPHPSGW